MPALPISGLPAGAAVGAANPFPTEQAGVTVQVTAAQIATFAQTTIVAALGLTKNAVSASDPTVNSDSSAGYAQGSRWLNTTSDRVWVAVDVTVGAAIWVPLGPPLSTGYVTGRYYGPYRTGITSVNATVADTIYAHRMVIEEAVTIDQLGARVVTGVAATSAWLGVYAEGAGGLPGALFAGTSAAVSTATSGSNVAATFASNPTLEPGTYWFATLTQGAVNFNNFQNSDPLPSAVFNYGSANQNTATSATGQTIGASAASAFGGGLPNPFPAAAFQGTGAMPILSFRKA